MREWKIRVHRLTCKSCITLSYRVKTLLDRWFWGWPLGPRAGLKVGKFKFKFNNQVIKDKCTRVLFQSHRMGKVGFLPGIGTRSCLHCVYAHEGYTTAERSSAVDLKMRWAWGNSGAGIGVKCRDISTKVQVKTDEARRPVRTVF